MRALDQVKAAKAESERTLQKKVDEAVKEAATHVSRDHARSVLASLMALGIGD